MILTKENITSIDIDGLINEKIDSGNIERLLIIVPTNRKQRNLKKEIISMMPNHSAAEVKIETLGTLSTKMLQSYSPLISLSEAASVIFIKQSAAEIKSRYFSIYKHEIPFGTLDKIKNVITEYKRHGITPDHLRAEATNLDKSEKLKALDIADIYEKYLAKCKTLNAYDLGDVYRELNNLPDIDFQNIFAKSFPSTELIVINGFDEFSNPEIHVINSLSNSTNVKLFINFDYNENNKALFSHLDKIYDRYTELGFKKISDKSSSEFNPFIEKIRNELFHKRSKQVNQKYKEKIYKISAFNREKEVDLISKEIKKLIIEKKVEPHKIAVVFNRIQNYSDSVRDLFSKNGLPFNLSDRISLNNSNPVISLVNFLEIAENDYYFNNIFRALSGGYIEIPNLDYSNLYKVASILKIISGKENWINTLREEINIIKLNSDEDEDFENLKLASFQKALSDLIVISEFLKPFEEKLTIEQFQNKLNEFIYKSGLPEKLLNTNSFENDTSVREENIRGFTEFIETVTEVFELLKEEYGSDKKLPLSFFMDQIRTASAWARFNVKEKSNYGIQITSLNEIRGLQFDHLFIGGLCDGDLPTRYVPEIFRSGSFKKQAAVHQAEERNLFYQALSCWKEKLYLSFPSTESGHETVESTFIKDFEELFEISMLNENDFSSTIYSNEELDIFIGQGNNVDLIPKELMKDNEFDKRKNSIAVNKIRESNPFADSNYCGNLASNELASDFLKSFKEKQYSISQLETYAACPFKFFVERVIGIERIEEPSEEIEAIEMGRFLHSILFEFYSRVRDEKLQIQNCDEKIFSKIQKIIYETAEKEIGTSAFKSPITFYEKEKIFGIGGDKSESILNRFLEYERNEPADFIPKHFEVNFGKLRKEGSDTILRSDEPVNVAGIKLRGKIDRVDINNEDSSFNIVDYKLSGKKPSISDLKAGISLQLPVYLFAAAQLLKKHHNKSFSPNDMIIYSLKYALDEFGKKIISIKRDKEIESIEQLINITVSHIENYVEGISHGKFGLSPHANREQLVCRFCSFKSVCRIEDVD